MALARSPALDDPLALRHAGRELLGLALMDTRNLLLALLPRLEDAADGALRRRVLAAGAWPEWWIGRNVQRARGPTRSLRASWRCRSAAATCPPALPTRSSSAICTA